VIDLVILGAGGTGLDALDCVDAINAISPRYRCVGFLDDDLRKQVNGFAGLPVLGSLSDAPKWRQARFVNALGGPGSFRQRPATLKRAGITDEGFETLVHPAAVVSSRAELGRGILVYPHVTVGPNVHIGHHVQILANVVANHDVRIGDWTIIASGAAISGRVRLGSCCYIGTGAVLKEDLVVGDGALVGMGAVVTRDVAPSITVIGNPARAKAPMGGTPERGA
jgi:sugar O-acyltransferase (sialic acid O-acetyltransferase NeuD family)